jgi:uncharacterized membrane protein YjgN (DUF898 family)
MGGLLVSANATRFTYDGTGSALLLLLLKNALLTVLTLGIYSFWARNAVRQFRYDHTLFDGDRFAYHGTGGELLRGAIKAFAVMFLLGLVLAVAGAVMVGDTASPVGSLWLTLVFYGIVGLLIIVAINGARKYRMSRSAFRGIRFSFHGELGSYFVLMVRGILFSIFTLGFYMPYFANQRRAFLVDNALYGSEPFLYDGEGKDLFGEYVKAVLFTIPTLGLYWLWYKAFEHRYFWSHTAMRDARFHSTVTGGEMFRLYATNLLLVVCTFGIGAPWATTRAHTYFAENLVLLGSVEWTKVQQRMQPATATAEGLAQGFDIDVGIGL